jgi:hypothetical protein
MATVSNVVEMVLKLKGSREFQSEATKSARAAAGIGKAAESSGKKAKVGWKNVAATAGMGAAVYKATAYIKGAVTATEDLAKNTMAVQRATGLDTTASSQWAEVLKVRGVNTKQFNTSMTKLSKLMEAARGGNTKAIDTFRTLGVSQDAIAKGDINSVLMQTADAMQRIKNPAQRMALSQAALGKGAQLLMPLLMGGSQAIQDQMDMAKKYGAVISNTDDAKKMIASQREMTYAFDGLKVQLGEQLMPVIVELVGMFMKVVTVMQPILRNSVALQAVVLGLSYVFLGLKVNALLAAAGFATLDASILLIPAAIIAVVAGLAILYTKWGWFHRAVDNTFNWIKKNWPLLTGILLGPIGVAVIEIIRNWGKIKSAFEGVVHGIANRWRDLINFVKRAAGTIASTVGSVTGAPGKFAGKVGGFLQGAFADGGTMPNAGLALVGERGPEVVALPRAAHVTPIDRAGLPGVGGGTVITKVFLDRRQIAEAVGGYTADRKARR